MAILAQCGFGRSQKVEQGFAENVLKGAIISPRDEARPRLEQALRDWRAQQRDAVLLFDPQFYAATLNAPRDGHLSEYDYYSSNSGLGRTHFAGTRIRAYVKDCIDYQHNCLERAISYIVAPSILFDGFRDYWSQVAINMAAESADYHAGLAKPRPLLVSVIVSGTAFQSFDAMEEYLDALTELDVDGFYVVVRRNAGFLQHAMEPASFGRLMYFCYVLAEINEYDLVVGYSDWLSFLLQAAGADHTACGWYQNLRQFSLARFQPAGGGRRPRRRYSSRPLLTCPLVTPELQDIHLAGRLRDALSGSTRDRLLTQPDPAYGEPNWDDEVACLAHWFSLASLSEQVQRERNVRDRLRAADSILERSLALHRRLLNLGISFEPQSGPDHIPDWQDGLREFRRLARL